MSRKEERESFDLEIVYFQAWSPGGYCESYWLPADQAARKMLALKRKGWKVKEISSS